MRYIENAFKILLKTLFFPARFIAGLPLYPASFMERDQPSTNIEDVVKKAHKAPRCLIVVPGNGVPSISPYIQNLNLGFQYDTAFVPAPSFDNPLIPFSLQSYAHRVECTIQKLLPHYQEVVVCSHSMGAAASIDGIHNLIKNKTQGLEKLRFIASHTFKSLADVLLDRPVLPVLLSILLLLNVYLILLVATLLVPFSVMQTLLLISIAFASTAIAMPKGTFSNVFTYVFDSGANIFDSAMKVFQTLKDRCVIIQAQPDAVLTSGTLFPNEHEGETINVYTYDRSILIQCHARSCKDSAFYGHGDTRAAEEHFNNMVSSH